MLTQLRSARFVAMAFGALVFVLGAQSMRFLFGSISWYLRDTIGIGVLDLIPIALAPFVLGLVLPSLTRWLSVHTTMAIGVGLLALARLVNQAASEPAIDLWSSAVATAAFVGLLPLLLSIGRPALVGGVLLGLAVDGAIKGFALSLDLAYRPGIGPLLAVTALVVATVLVFSRLPSAIERRGAGWGRGAALLALGPFLFFQALVLQNQGWTAELTGLTGAGAQLRITVLNVMALAVVGYLGRSRAVAAVSLVVFVAAAALAEGDPTWFGVAALLAIPAGGLVLSAMVPDPDEPAVRASGTYLVAASTLFVVLGLAYYVPIDLDIGLTQSQVRLVAVVLMAGLGAVGVMGRPSEAPATHRGSWAVAAAFGLLSVAGLLIAAFPADPGEASPGLRVMTYNIHSAFNTDGGFDIEAIAAVIEESGASVVGLQEVPRGRLLSGVTDEVAVLQHRLGFPHVAFFGTTDPTWGNAILSRHPITRVETAYLPLVGTPMRRGYLGADLEVGGETVLFVSTHLQHVNDRAVHEEDPEADLYPVHHEQIATILEAWDGQEPAILVGDFNARPGWRQLEELLDAGWVDSWAEVGDGDGFTANAANPRYRIDYVFHTPDLAAVGAVVPPTQASDHFPVVVDLAAP